MRLLSVRSYGIFSDGLLTKSLGSPLVGLKPVESLCGTFDLTASFVQFFTLPTEEPVFI